MRTLEEILVQTRLLSPSQLAVAQRDAEMRHKRLAPTIIDLGMVSDGQFAEWMAQVTRLPVVDPLPEDAAYLLERRLPRAIAREYEVVPVALNGDTVTVAMVNPLDQDCLEVLRTTTGLNVTAVIAVYGSLIQLVNRLYPEDDREPTILPQWNPSGAGPASSPWAEAPFEAGSETLLRSHRQPFALVAPDQSPGSTTRIIAAPQMRPDETTNPVTSMTPVSEDQLSRLERHLSDQTRAIERMERRLDAIDATLARVLSRRVE